MVGSFQHIKVCIQNSGKQCGGHLAFASSKYLDDFAILIACCLLVSFFCRCITYDTIKEKVSPGRTICPLQIDAVSPTL